MNSAAAPLCPRPPPFPPRSHSPGAGPTVHPSSAARFQAAFVLLNLWIGARFYFFVRYYESGGQTALVGRPPGVEGWLPIAGLMNLKYALLTGSVPDVHPAAMFLLVAFVAISFVARKAFCSWLCPVGTLSEWLWEGGREIFGRNFQAPRWLDIPLRSLKYLLLGFFGYAVASMTVPDLHAFITSPYGLVADVKMLNFFRHIGTTGAAVIAVLLVGSVFVKNLWCRYLCPYGALVGLVSLFSPARIRREADVCIDCAKCAKACPVAAAGRHAHHGEVRRVHRLPRVRGRLPGRRGACGSRSAARAPSRPGPSRPPSRSSSSASSATRSSRAAGIQMSRTPSIGNSCLRRIRSRTRSRRRESE